MINHIEKSKNREFKEEILNDDINKILNDSFSIPKEKEISFNYHNLLNQDNNFKNYTYTSSNTLTTVSTTLVKNDIMNSKIIKSKINVNKSKINKNSKQNIKPIIKEKKKVSFNKKLIEIIHVKNWKKYNKINNIDLNDNYNDLKKKVEYCKCLIY